MKKMLCCITFSNLQNCINTSKKPKQLAIKSNNISQIINSVLSKLIEKLNIEIIYPITNSDFIGLGNTLLFISNCEKIQDEITDILSNIDIMALEVYFCFEELNSMDDYKSTYQNVLKQIFIKKLNRISFYNMYSNNYKKTYINENNIFEFDTKYKTADTKNNSSIKAENMYSVSHYALGDYDSKDNTEKFYKILSDDKNKIDIEKFFDNSFYIDEHKYNSEFKENVSNLKEYISNNQLSRYYILYRLDIDDLGKKLSKNNNYKKQILLTEDISKFFSDINDKIQQLDCIAKLVYAGGDDLIAIFPVISGLKFATIIKDVSHTLDKHSLTYTQGIFITSIKSDFSEILRNSVSLLEKAKNYRTQKNLCILSVLTEGYSNKEMYIENEKLPNFYEVIKLFDLNISFFHQKIDSLIGATARHDFEKLHVMFENLFEYHLRRAIKSNKATIELNKKKFGIDKTMESIVEEIVSFVNDIIYIDVNITTESYLNFINTMSIIKFLLKGGEKRDAFDNYKTTR